MSEEPVAKRMKNSDEFPNLHPEVDDLTRETLIELDTTQHQLDLISGKAGEKILGIEKTFNEKRQPFYEKRKKLTSKIDDFWKTAFMNHHILSQIIPEEQEELIGALRDLEVQEFEDLRSGFKIIMTFDNNEFFENEVITRSYHLQSETPSIQITEIQWKGDRKPHVNSEYGDPPNTFLEWLTSTVSPDSDEIADVIKDDLFINPLQYYVMPDVQEVEKDDIEGFMNEERGLDEKGQPIRRMSPINSSMIDVDKTAKGEEALEKKEEETGEDEEESDEEEGKGDDEEEEEAVEREEDDGDEENDEDRLSEEF